MRCVGNHSLDLTLGTSRAAPSSINESLPCTYSTYSLFSNMTASMLDQGGWGGLFVVVSDST